MEALLSQFSSLANQALTDKNFDPSRIEELMKLFEQEAFDSWTIMEMAQQKELKEAEASMREAEAYLGSLMDSAMNELEIFEQLEQSAKSELQSLVQTAETARSMGNSMTNAATIASKKYMDAALGSATASFRSAWNGLSINPGNKVHPS